MMYVRIFSRTVFLSVGNIFWGSPTKMNNKNRIADPKETNPTIKSNQKVIKVYKPGSLGHQFFPIKFLK